MSPSPALGWDSFHPGPKWVWGRGALPIDAGKAGLVDGDVSDT